MIDELRKAHWEQAKARYKKGVMMNEEGTSRVARSVKQGRRQVAGLALRVSEARHGVLMHMRSAEDAGEVELARRLCDVWNSLGAGDDCLLDAWAQLSAIEKDLL